MPHNNDRSTTGSGCWRFHWHLDANTGQQRFPAVCKREEVIASKKTLSTHVQPQIHGKISFPMQVCPLRETAKKGRHWKKVILFFQQNVYCHRNFQSLSVPTPSLLSTGLSMNLQLILRLDFICFHINAINFHWKMHLRHSVKIGLK